MRVGLQWLREFVPIDVTVDELAEKLDLSGTKVEAIHRPSGAIEGVVVAEVLGIDEHPNADNLILVDVSSGSGDNVRVVCGARNFGVGDRVPYATVGARLPDIEIVERKIRGEVSRGMLCSAAELGISKDHSGILVLPPDAPLGKEVTPLLGLDDTVLELEITPNRPDCMSMIGVAREAAALLGHELTLPDASVNAADDLASPVAVDIADEAGCPRYLARYLEDVSIGPSPLWLATRLLAAGVRPISNVVDATNYVMLETGQPLHAFDAALVADASIVVRRARSGEVLTTLDGVERRLDEADLLIADPSRALAIAGVMGGADSEVSPETNAVILESAHFEARSIALTSRRHVLRSEASARFERGTDPEMVPFAAARATRLIADLAGGRASQDVTDAYPRPIARERVTLRPRRVGELLGLAVDAGEQVQHLRSIGFEVEDGAGESVDVLVPTFRPDVRREADLLEEVARLVGFERLPATIPPGRAGGLERAQVAERHTRAALAGFGLQEAWTPAFMSLTELDALCLPEDHAARSVVTLSNPMTEDERALRTTLLPGLLRSVARNLAHRADSVALFEVAHLYRPAPSEALPEEPLTLAAVLCGPRRPQSWNERPARWDFFAAKGVIEALLSALRMGPAGFERVRGMPFHPTRAAQVVLEGAPLGAIGELHPDVCERFEVGEGTVAFELGLDPIFGALPPRPKVEALARFPSIYIDLAVVVDDPVPAGRVEEVIVRAGAPEVVSVRLFDLYTGEQLSAGKKSLAFALELRDPTRTMTDEDAAGVRDRILSSLAEEVDARLRT